MFNSHLINKPRIHGFTMLEALIALVVFSVGLLGLAGMQMAGLQNNQSAMLRTIAIQQSYDMAERIRANIGAVNTGAYDNMNINSVACALNSSCSSTPDNDFSEWYNVTQNMLPDSTAEIAGVAVDNNGDGVNDARMFTITVSWDNNRNGIRDGVVTLEFQP